MKHISSFCLSLKVFLNKQQNVKNLNKEYKNI